MKSLLNSTLAILVIGSLFFVSSCKKAEDEADPQLTQTLANSTVISKLKALGLTVIETGKPVQVEGIYEMKPVELTATNIPNDWKVGHVFEDSDKFQFSNQSDADQTIQMSYKIGDQTGSSSKGFVAGSGNKFTAYFITTTIYQTSTSEALEVFSGEWSSNGLKNMQHAFYILSKNDPDDLLVDVGAIRVSKDNDGITNTIASLRIAASNPDYDDYKEGSIADLKSSSLFGRKTINPNE